MNFSYYSRPYYPYPFPMEGEASHVIPKKLRLLQVSDLDAHFATSFGGVAWAKLTPAEKDVALAEAQRWLGALCWSSDADCCGRDFEEAYRMALAELALGLHNDQQAITGAGSTRSVKRQQLGDLSIEYMETTAANTKVSGRAPYILQRFPFLLDLLGCWLNGSWGSSRVLSRC